MEVQRVEQMWQEFIQKDNKGQSKCFDLSHYKKTFFQF